MKAILRYLLCITILIITLLGIIWQHTELITLDSNQIKLEQELHSLKNRHKRLSIEVIKLKSPIRIEGLARELGFIYPPPEQMIILPEPEAIVKTDPKEPEQGWRVAKSIDVQGIH